MSKSSSVTGSLYLSLRYPSMFILGFFVRSVSSSSGCRRLLLNTWSTGLMLEMLTQASADRASVKSCSGFTTLFTDSNTSMSCHVGTRCLLFFSDPRTWAMAFSCSRTRSIIFCLEPHLAGISAQPVLQPSLFFFFN